MNGDKKCWSHSIKGEVQKWCVKCKFGDKLGRWTTNNRRHFTFEHSGGGPDAPHANICKVTSDSDSDSASSDSASPDSAQSSDSGPPVEKKQSFSSTLLSFADIAKGTQE